jgi:uncharacterized protein (DUF1499 family)
MKIARVLTLAMAFLAFAMMIAAGPGTKYDVWGYRVGFSLMEWGVYLGFAAGAVALVLLVLGVVPRWRKGLAMPLVALVLAVLAFSPPLMLRSQARGVPPIHDITTDAYDPPVFVALMEERKKAPNGADYGGPTIAAQQQKAYPDIKPIVVTSSPADALQRAIDAARSLGWQVVSSDAPSGRIEATDTTAWFGFKDDIVVRVRPEPTGGSRIDVRSVSRVGRSDLGANAKRIREFISKLA